MENPRSAIVPFAFENMLREMAIDPQPLPARLWSSFYESVVNEDINAQLRPPIKEKLDEFSEFHFSVEFHELDAEIVYGAIERLSEATARSAFDWLMRIKDAISSNSNVMGGAQ